MTALDVIDRTRCYVLENFLYARPDVRLSDEEHLLARGIIDSLGVVELVQFLQDEFGIAVGDDDVVEQNFASLQAIAGFVVSKRTQSAA